MDCLRLVEKRSTGPALRWGYPRFASPPGWFADVGAEEQSAERAVLAAARQWTRFDDAPLHLMGFSKSGFAALSILARHWRSGLFAGAAAWDAPLMMERMVRPSMRRSYGSEEVFAQHCLVRRISDLGDAARAGARLVLDGFMIWGAQMNSFHKLLTASNIPHAFHKKRRATHRWDSEWMMDCARLLTESGPQPGLPRMVGEVDA